MNMIRSFSSSGVSKIALSFLFLGAVCLQTIHAKAEDYYVHCNKVLEGDMFNKVISNVSDQNEAKQLVWHTFLSTSESEAWDTYSRNYESTKTQGSGAGLSYGVANAKYGQTYSRKLSESEFRQLYQKMHALNRGASHLQHNTKTSHVSNLSVLTRDQGSIKAWEECVSRAPVPGMYVYGRRSEAGQASIKVLWSPGNFAGATPNIRINFSTSKGISVDAKENLVMGTGGQAFSVETDTDDKSVELDVNGAILVKGEPIANWTEKAIIPPKVLPVLIFPKEEPLGVQSVRNLSTKYCLDTDGRAVKGGAVRLWSCQKHPNQEWVETKQPSASQLRNLSSNFCLDTDGVRKNGGLVRMWECVDHPNQLWDIQRLPDGNSRFQNKASGFCLDSDGNSANGAGIRMWECVSHPNQTWAIGASIQ